MSTLWEAVISLQPIIDTASAEDIVSDPESVETRYRTYSRLFFPHEAVRRVEDKLIKEIKTGRSVTGYISGEYGYGKTATAVYLWRRCQNAGICSVPPFLFRSLNGMMDAVMGWVKNSIEHTNRDLISPLEELYNRFKFRSREEMAEQISQEKAIPISKARDIVRDYIAQSRDLMSVPILLRFLTGATDIVLEAGMRGLVIFTDELQEFIRSEELFREQVQKLSELVKGIRAESIPLGVIFTMPPTPTKMILEEQTGDVMQRLREKEIFIELEGAYTRDFPKQIWQYACKSFNAEESLRIIPPETLDALGQICIRGDLSNGPRTVISVFKRAALHWQTRQVPYTPLDMMEDYLNGHIVFEGREQKISAILNGLMDIRPVRQSPEYQKAIKLMAAFPNGVSAEIAGKYGLEDMILELAEREGFIGKYIIQLPEGYALVELQRQPPRGGTVEELLNRFRSRWFSASSPEEKLEAAKLAFISRCIEHLFPRRKRGGKAFWSGHPDLDQKLVREIRSFPVYTVTLSGIPPSLERRHPHRKVIIALATEEEVLSKFAPDEETDLVFRFFLEKAGPDKPGSIETAKGDKTIDIHLNLDRRFGERFPGQLGMMQRVMSPQHCTAEVLLNFMLWLDAWLQDHKEISAAEKAGLEEIRNLMVRFSISLLMPPGIDVIGISGLEGSAERNLIERIIEIKLNEIYPDYKPLKVDTRSANLLRNYKLVLSRTSLAQRRGHEPIMGTKEKIAELFGTKPSSFPSIARNLAELNLMMDFSESRDWKGKGENSQAQIRLKLHPLEEDILQQLKRSNRSLLEKDKELKVITDNQIYKIEGKKGYIKGEVDEALDLLDLRGYIKRDGGMIIEKVQELEAESLRFKLHEIRENLANLHGLFPDKGRLSDLEDILREAEIYIEKGDEESLDSADRRLDNCFSSINTFVKTKFEDLMENLRGIKRNLERLLTHDNLSRDLKEITGNVQFATRIDDYRQKLIKDRDLLRGNAQSLMGEVDSLISRSNLSLAQPNVETLVRLWEEFTRLNDEFDDFRKEVRSWYDERVPQLERWRGIVLKASNVRGDPGVDEEIKNRIDDEFSVNVLTEFAEREMEALADYQRFEVKISNIEEEVKSRVRERRQRFNELKERYESALADLTPDRVINANYDPQSPESSYKTLYSQVIDKLGGVFGNVTEDLNRYEDDLKYLREEREKNVEEELKKVFGLRDSLNRYRFEINLDSISDFETFSSLCERISGIKAELTDLRRRISQIRGQLDPLDETESKLYSLLPARERVTVEKLRSSLKEAGIEMDTLQIFEVLGRLYKKGYLSEINLMRSD